MTACRMCGQPAALLGDDIPEQLPTIDREDVTRAAARMLGWWHGERTSTAPLCVACADDSWANVRLLAQEDTPCMTTA